MRRTRAVLSCLFLTGVGLLASCSSFDRDWEVARAGTPADAETPAGAWEGRWKSESTGHAGELRAIISRAGDDGDGANRYTARFHATWGSVFSSEYSLPLRAKPAEDGGWVLDGHADLGWMWGRYDFEGRVEDSVFRATYRTEKNHGSFEMTRAAPEKVASGRPPELVRGEPS